MKTRFQEIAANLFHEKWIDLNDRERYVIEHFTDRKRISRNTNKEFADQLTFGQRVADQVAAFGGSWLFIFLFGLVLMIWIVLNTVVLARRGIQFDPYPFILLNLLLSMLAAVQAPVILMSQNRQVAKDRIDAAHDYEVNLKAELEIMAIYEKLNNLSEKQFGELLALQREQIELVRKLLAANGIDVNGTAPPKGTA